MAELHLSDHSSTFCDLSDFQNVNHKKFAYYRRLNQVNKTQFIADFHQLPWSLIDATGAIDDAVDTFEKLFFQLWDCMLH